MTTISPAGLLAQTNMWTVSLLVAKQQGWEIQNKSTTPDGPENSDGQVAGSAIRQPIVSGRPRSCVQTGCRPRGA